MRYRFVPRGPALRRTSSSPLTVSLASRWFALRSLILQRFASVGTDGHATPRASAWSAMASIMSSSVPPCREFSQTRFQTRTLMVAWPSGGSRARSRQRLPADKTR
ncbi:hypothetical protein CDN99_26035 [Roseateles aquatilis]|uniref:Uncharacterized protein n=1 Tax=Roseateles aquatilis TaxID=431061 RepID=A0A246ITP3_9BURK|nr:hypothetical protein CDN99_26035 [Roseateles aquatilis]